MNRIKLPFLMLLVFLSLSVKSQTTYSWANYPTKCSGASVYTQPNMTVSVSGTGFSNRGPQAATSACASTSANRFFSPKYVVTGNSSAPDWQATGLGIGVDWSNIVSNPPSSTVDVVFTDPVCTPLSFSIYDINSGTCCGVSVIWKDIVSISAVDGSGNTIYPLAANVSPLNGNSYASGTGTITAGNYGATNLSTTITFPSSQVAAIKSLKIVYRSGTITNDPYTVSGTDPDPQYIIISNITASSPTVSVTASAIPCGSTTTTLTSTTNASSPTYAWTGSAGTSIASPTAASTSVTGAGTYTLTVTSGGVGGCTASTVYTVTSSGTPPSLTMSSDQVMTCASASATVSASSSTSGVTYAWSGPGSVSPNNATSGTVTTPGIYTVTVTQTATGCSSTGTMAVTTNTVLPNISMGANQALTCGVTTATISGSSSTGGVSYSWNGPGAVSPNNAASGSVTAAGIYTLTVTNPINGCSNTGTVSVSSSTSAPSVSVGAPQSITCSSASATVSGSSGTSGVNYLWTGPGTINPNNSTSGTVTTAGVYTLTVTDPSNNCSSAATVSVTLNNTPPVMSMGANQSITCNAASVTVSGSSPVAGATYSWSGPDVVTPSNQSSGSVSSAGNYTLTVTDPATGCTNTGIVTVTENLNSPGITMGAAADLTCNTATVTVSGSSNIGTATYLWTGPGTVSPGNTASGTVTVAGTYTLTITNPANGCSTTGQVIIGSNMISPDLTMGTNATIDCASSNATITGSSSTTGVDYFWAGPGTVSPNSTSSGSVTVAGTYSLVVTDPANGCTTTGTIDVVNNSAAPSITMGADQTIDCSVSNATVSGTTGISNPVYSWSGPGVVSPNNGSSGTVTVAGTYTLSITDPSNGCSSSGVVNVLNNSAAPDISVAQTQTLSCLNGQAVVSGSSSTPGVSYAWSGPGTVAPANLDSGIVTVAGTYTLTVTDPSNNCSVNATLVVNPASGPSQPLITASGPTTICAGDSVTITSSSITGNNWNTGETSQSIIVAAAGSYSVTVTDINGCSATSAAVQITINTLPVVTAGSTAIVMCEGASITLNAAGAATYSWTGGITDGVAFIPSGSQTYTVTGTDVNGCSDTATVSIAVNAAPDVQAAASSVSVCEGAATTLTGSGIAGGNYSWSGGVTDNTPFIPLASGTYTVTGADSNGCTDTATVFVAVNQLPSAPVVTTIGSGNAVCAGQNIILSANPGTGITWQPGGQTSPTISVSASGTYSASITDANGCVSAAGDITVTVNPNPLLDMSGLAINAATCGFSNGSLTGITVNSGTAPYSFQWYETTTNTAADTGIILNNSAAGNYYLVVTDAAGCTAATSGITIPALGGVNVNLSGTPLTGLEPLDVVLTATTDVQVVNYSWLIGTSQVGSTTVNSFGLTGLTYGTHTAGVIVTDVYGCQDTAHVTILVDTEIEIVIPNVFTPNGDGVNEVFTVDTKGIKVLEAQIFNRWGQKIYSWNSVQGSWDGKINNGEFAPEGTYYFIIDYTDVNDKVYNRTGFFLLVK